MTAMSSFDWVLTALWVAALFPACLDAGRRHGYGIAILLYAIAIGVFLK